MSDIFHDFPIKAPAGRVFQGVTTPEDLDAWWTKTSSGEPMPGSIYELGFGPGYQWRGKVTRAIPDAEFELELVEADSDWTGTRVGFQLEPRNGATWVRFHHTGWPQANEHYRISCNCWALYLRILRRYLELGEQVPYEQRLSA
jgi:uncharacterized protein YndB with AHSA1/START domain